MCCLSLSELSAETRNAWGLPTADETDPVMMGANDMSIERRERRRICDDLAEDQSVPDWYRQATAQNIRKRTFERALFWATLVGVWFGLLIGFTVSMWWLT